MAGLRTRFTLEESPERPHRPNRIITRTEYIQLPGRDVVDFAASDGQSVMQLMEFAQSTFGAWQGVYFGNDPHIIFNYSDGRSVSVRDPKAEELRDASFKQLPKVWIPFQIKVPASILQKA
jgi:hypothetical protein